MSKPPRSTSATFSSTPRIATTGSSAQQDSLVTFNISATGRLGFVEATNAHAWYSRTFSINSAGDLAAVGGQTSSNVAILTRDPATGRLGKLLASVQVATPGRSGQEDGLSAVVWKESSQ